MSTSTATAPEIIRAYRNLYRALLHAVQYSKPLRYVARDKLRTSFRLEDPSNFSHQRIQKTLEFLENAAREKGDEHKLVKNLLHTSYWRAANLKLDMPKKNLLAAHLKDTAYVHYDMTVAMLNDSMGLCLR